MVLVAVEGVGVATWRLLCVCACVEKGMGWRRGEAFSLLERSVC